MWRTEIFFHSCVSFLKAQKNKTTQTTTMWTYLLGLTVLFFIYWFLIRDRNGSDDDDDDTLFAGKKYVFHSLISICVCVCDLDIEPSIGSNNN